MIRGILYTSYFANWRNWKKIDNTFNIAVTRFKPKYIDFDKEGIELIQPLAPPKELLSNYKNKIISEGEFRNQFINYISTNKESVISLNQICLCLDQGTNILLLCYEKKDCFCHRHILAEVFDELGYETKEI